MRVAILGGGIGGLSLAWFLASAVRGSANRGAWEVEVFERAPSLGGLITSFVHRGLQFDRHYHCVLTGDRHVRNLVRDLSLSHLIRYTRSQMGFYDDGRLIPFNTPVDLLRFPLLTAADRMRLVKTLLYCQRWGDLTTLNQQPLEDWLVGLGGRPTFEKVWAPLLRSRFDGSFAEMPATYLWSRLRRMQTSREKGGSVEKLGILRGGTSSLVGGLVTALGVAGVRLRCGEEVVGIHPAGNSTRVALGNGSTSDYDLVISTLATPIHNRLSGPDSARSCLELPHRYLGILDLVVALDHSLTPFYSLNLLDESLPFTAVIETTHLMSPEDHAGTHLVYLPRYIDAGSDLYQASGDTIRALFLGHLKRMFPSLKDSAIQGTYLFREPYVEPVHALGGPLAMFPECLYTQRRGVYLMNTGRLYPELHNCQAVIGLARRTADFLLERYD